MLYTVPDLCCLIKINITDKLATIYKNPAVIPFLGREIAPAPTKAQNLRIEGNLLKWEASGDVRSVVYHFPDISKVGVVLSVTNATSVQVNASGFYCVTTINKDNKESAPSETIEIK